MRWQTALVLVWTMGCEPTSDSVPKQADPGTPAEDDGGGDGGDVGDDDAVVEGYAASTRADLRIKRWRQLVRDLGGALALPEDQICAETGLYQCTDLHVVPLGGISVDNGLYAPVDGVAVTTGLAIERLVLQACSNRVEADLELLAAGEDAVVFGDLAELGDALEDAAVDAQAVTLYRRLLARDPLPAEQEIVRMLAADTLAFGGDAAAFATTACFMVGTTTEFLTY